MGKALSDLSGLNLSFLEAKFSQAQGQRGFGFVIGRRVVWHSALNRL